MEEMSCSMSFSPLKMERRERSNDMREEHGQNWVVPVMQQHLCPHELPPDIFFQTKMGEILRIKCLVAVCLFVFTIFLVYCVSLK